MNPLPRVPRSFPRTCAAVLAAGAACLASSAAAASADTTPLRLGGSGKLRLTGGVSSIDGAAGGGLTPWAVTASHATQGEVGGTAHLTHLRTGDYELLAQGVALTVSDRFEMSLAQQRLDASVVVPGTTLRQDIVGLKWRIAGDAVLEADSLLPQLALGLEYKRLQPGEAVGAVLDSVQARREGVDLYVSATKLWLAQGVLLNGTLRATRANQNGLLGFGAVGHQRYRWQPELSIAKLLRRDLAVGIEVRTQPDNLAFAGDAFRENAWRDVFIAWAPSKHLSLTLAHVDLGQVVGRPRQRGTYLSLQLSV